MSFRRVCFIPLGVKHALITRSLKSQQTSYGAPGSGDKFFRRNFQIGSKYANFFFRNNDFQQVISRICKELRCCYCGVGLSHECCNTWNINSMLAHCMSEIHLSKNVKFLFLTFSPKTRFNHIYSQCHLSYI